MLCQSFAALTNEHGHAPVVDREKLIQEIEVGFSELHLNTIGQRKQYTMQALDAKRAIDIATASTADLQRIIATMREDLKA